MEQIIRFGQSNRQFFSTLRSRVDEYFKTNNLSKNANSKMVIKTISMLSIYLVPYAFMLSGLVTLNAWMIIGLYIMMGVGMSGVGFSIS